MRDTFAFVTERGQYWSTARQEWVSEDSPYLAIWRDGDNRTVECATALDLDELLRQADAGDLSPLPRRDIPPLEFRQRFTEEERLAVHSAALSSPAIAAWLADAAAAQRIDVLDQKTIDGVAALVSSGLLDPARLPEILRRGD